MNRLWQIIIIALLLTPFGWSQSPIPISNMVISQYGQPVPGASVRVCLVTSSGTPCVPTSTIYSDYNLTQPIPNPTTADANGNFTVFAPPLETFPALYLVQVSPQAGTTYDYVVDGSYGGTAFGCTSPALGSITCSGTIDAGALNSVQILDNVSNVSTAINALALQTAQLGVPLALQQNTTLGTGSTLSFTSKGKIICGSYSLTLNGAVDIGSSLTQHFDSSCVAGTNFFINQPNQIWQAIWFNATDPGLGFQQIVNAAPAPPVTPNYGANNGAVDVQGDGYPSTTYTHTAFNTPTSAKFTSSCGTIYSDAWPAIGTSNTLAGTFPLFSWGGKLGSAQPDRCFGIIWGYPITAYSLSGSTLTLTVPFAPTQVNSPAGTPYVLTLARFPTSTWLDSTTLTVTSVTPTSIVGTWSGSHANASATEAGLASFPGNVRTVNDAAINASSTTLTSATAAFTQADAGAQVRVVGAGNSTGTADLVYSSGLIPLTIVSVTNGTTVTLSAPSANSNNMFGAALVIVPQGSAPVQISAPFNSNQNPAWSYGPGVLHDAFIDGGGDVSQGDIWSTYGTIWGSFAQPIQQGATVMKNVLIEGVHACATMLGATNNPAYEVEFDDVTCGTDATLKNSAAYALDLTLGPVSHGHWSGGVLNPLTTALLGGASHYSQNPAWTVQAFVFEPHAINLLGGSGGNTAGPQMGPLAVIGSSNNFIYNPDYDELEGVLHGSPTYLIPPQAGIEIGTSPLTDSTLGCSTASNSGGNTTVTASDSPFGWSALKDYIAIPGTCGINGQITAIASANSITVAATSQGTASSQSGYWGGGGAEHASIRPNRFYANQNVLFNTYIPNPWTLHAEIDQATWGGWANQGIGVTPLTYVSGGSFTGTGQCAVTFSNGSGSGGAGVIYIASGSVSPALTFVTAAGYGYGTTLPTTATVGTCTPAGLVTGSGTITVSGGLKTGFGFGIDSRANASQAVFKGGASLPTAPGASVGVQQNLGQTAVGMPWNHATISVDGQTPAAYTFQSWLVGDVAPRISTQAGGYLLYGDGTGVSGVLYGTFTYVSGSSSCTNGTQAVTFIDPGSTGTGAGTITVSGNVPTGNITLTAGSMNFSGLPTTATIATCTGTATISGGSIVNHYGSFQFAYNSGLTNPEELEWLGTFYANYLVTPSLQVGSGGTGMTANTGNSVNVQHGTTGTTVPNDWVSFDVNSNTADSGAGMMATIAYTSCTSCTGGVAATTMFTTANDSTTHQYRQCYSMTVTSAGTAGTFQAAPNYTLGGSSYTTALGSTISYTVNSTNAASGTSCAVFNADANTAIKYQIVASGVTGTPTLGYSVSLEKLR